MPAVNRSVANNGLAERQILVELLIVGLVALAEVLTLEHEQRLFLERLRRQHLILALEQLRALICLIRESVPRSRESRI